MRGDAVSGGLRYALAGRLGGTLLDALMLSTRVAVENEAVYRDEWAAGRPVLFICWHGRLLPLGHVHRGQGVVGLASRSADGEYISRLLQHWGFEMVRGSSSRGGDVAFRELVRLVRGGRSVAITPDGPRGPREKIKPGVLQLAQLTGAPVIPVMATADRAWWFGGWDRFMVPKPFARLRVAYGAGLRIERGSGAAGIERAGAELERGMAALLTRLES
jgi:lysophospholipid acyltransferase (LPLAT)-like uncharacterized protein